MNRVKNLGVWARAAAALFLGVTTSAVVRAAHSEDLSEIEKCISSPGNNGLHWSSTHSLRPKRVANPYFVVDFHLLHHAGFNRRFHNVPAHICCFLPLVDQPIRYYGVFKRRFTCCSILLLRLFGLFLYAAWPLMSLLWLDPPSTLQGVQGQQRRGFYLWQVLW